MIQYTIWSEDWEKFRKLFTVENKNIEKLERVMKRKMPRARFIKLYITEWDKYLFPIWRFNKHLEEDVFSQEVFAETFTNFKCGSTPTEEQTIVLNEIKEWRRTGLIVMKTWTGKSYQVMQMVDHFRECVVILTHNLATLYEMKEKFKNVCGVDIWEFHGAKKIIKPITVSTHSSFMKNWKTLKDKMRFSQIIFDEADSSVSDKMLTAIIKFDPSSLFWMTWTPKRTELDWNDLQLIYGKIIKCEGQINNWYKILPDIVRLKYNTKVCSYEDHWDMKAQLMWEKERIEKQILFIIESIVFEDVKYWLLLVERREEESQEYYNLLSPHINCVLINWHTKKEDDLKNIQFIKQNWWIIVGTLKKVWRWVDIPFLDWVFIFFQNHFYSLVVQAVWRWLRSYPGKNKITLYDWIDVPISSKSAATRLQSYRQEYPWCKITDFNI